ncbi:uncharacterized protein LOC134949595 isoform X2 [Pseudophryne corroboree]|uniref:uncharacterized protein LOC134949595 isoform X2 n=1 Tax=Pseudophryne corroboree TaxID=495146 RepID=UPI00308190A5
MVFVKPSGRSVDIRGQLGSGRPPVTKAGAAGLPQKQWLMRRHDRTGEAAVIPEKKRRGRPPLAMSDTLDSLRKRKYGHAVDLTDKDMGVSEERQRIYGAPKDETCMISIDSANKNPAIPKRRKRGRPPLYIPKTEQMERAIDNPNEVVKSVEKRGRGRPLGSGSKTAQNKTFVGPKRARGRPRKTELLLLNETPKVPVMSALTKHITVRLTKMNEDLIMMAGREARLKVENNTVRVKNREEAKAEIMQKKKCIMVELEDIMNEKRRGRPKKQQPIKETHQSSFSSSSTWPQNIKYEASQDSSHFSGDFTSHKEQAPTETAVGRHNAELLAEAHSSSVEPQDCWETEEVRMQHCPEWDTKPAQTVWTTEEGAESLDSSSVTQFVVGESLTPQPSQPPLPAEPNVQEDLLRELSAFRCQLTKELTATRVEVREGAELVRSAIAGVSAEINRLGLILQPLVNVLSAGNLFCRPTNFSTMTSLLHPQQDTPPDDTVDVPQSSTLQKNSFACRPEKNPFNHLTPRDTPTECSTESLPEIISPVKTEDLTDNLQPCAYQAKSIVSLQVAKPITQSSFLPKHDIRKACSINSSPKLAPSTIPDFSENIPPPNMHHVNTLDCLQENSASTHSVLFSDHEAPFADSLAPAPEVASPASHGDVMDSSSQRDSPPIISAPHDNHDKSTMCSTGSPLEDSSPSRSTDCCTQDLSPPNSEMAHPERDTDSVHHQCSSPENAEDASVPNVSSSPVNLPGSSTGDSLVMTQDQEEMNLEEISLKETLSKSSQDVSELSHTAETCAVPQSVCAQPTICTKMLLNFDVASQSPPTSPLACASLLAMDGEVPPILQCP